MRLRGQEQPREEGRQGHPFVTGILQRNMRDLARVDALHTLPNLLKLLAARASGLLNLAERGPRRNRSGCESVKGKGSRS